jgi:hypothetical protein
MVTLLFFIFESPQLVDFADESLSQCGVSRKFDCLYFSHKVAVVLIVAVIVAKHASVIRGTSSQVYVGKTVGNNLLIFKPNLLFQKRTLSLSFEPVCLTRRVNGRFLLRHGNILPQVGVSKSYLVEGVDRNL